MAKGHISNTRHATTLRTPSELLFNRTPRTRLLFVHPCTPQHLEQSVELKVGYYSLEASDKGMICDLCPNANEKWRKGTVARVFGPLYGKYWWMAISGKPILICRDCTEQYDNTTPLQQYVTSPKMEADDTIVPLTPLEVDIIGAPQQELITPWPIRNHHPLIEGIP